MITRWSGWMKLDSVLSRVVLPEPVPPEMMMFSRAFMAPSMSASISGVNALKRSRSSLVERARAEHPDGDHGAVECQRRDDGVEPRAVGQPGVDHRRGLVDAAADPRDDPVDDLEQVLVVAENDFRLLDPAFLLDEDLLGAVDHDVADLVVLEQELERTEAEGLVEDLVDQTLPLVAVQERVLGVAEVLDHAPDLVAQRLRVHLADPVHVEPVDQPHVDMALERLVLLDGRVRFLDRLRAGGGGGGGGWAAMPEAGGGGSRCRRRRCRATGSASDRRRKRASWTERACVPDLAASESAPQIHEFDLEKGGEQPFSRLLRTRRRDGAKAPGDLQDRLVRPAARGDLADRNPSDPRVLKRLDGDRHLPGNRHLQRFFGLLEADLRLDRAGPVDDQLDPVEPSPRTA